MTARVSASFKASSSRTLMLFALSCLVSATSLQARQPRSSDFPFHEGRPLLPYEFFAMDTGTKDASHQTAPEQVQMIRELGYAGIGLQGFAGLDAMLQELDRARLKLYNIYFLVDIDPGREPYDPLLKEAVRRLKGRDVMLWTAVTSRRFKPSSEEGDPDALRILGTVADLASEAGLKVALYPHTSYWLERIEDALRLTRKLGRVNAGVTFNLCHWLRVDDERNLRPLLQAAAPHLFVVSINGADRDCRGCDWNRLIQTLDRGSFDVRSFLEILKEIGFRGPIGLQGYGIGGSAWDNLQRSMKAWQEMTRARLR
jgi:sugar phosphate isomerase/epimerase